jgi:GT2 family glycosyltransferase
VEQVIRVESGVHAGDADASVPVSFIVPTFNAAGTVETCLRALRAAAPPGAEIVVSDDGSLDDTVARARPFADRVVVRPCQGGAARARNDGARVARGRVLFFVDADVVAPADAVAGALRHLERGADAVFGAYAPLPPPGFRNAATTYKNLLHHFTHRAGAGEAGTFWSGFGAVRREAFVRAGGFDPAVTTAADVEDIHLGYRLRAAGCRIVLDPALQVAHHKRYTVRSLVASDVFHRAVPWTRAMLELRTFRPDLNLRQSAIGAGACFHAAVACAVGAGFLGWPLAIAAGALALAWAWQNRGFLGFVRRAWGFGGALISALLLALYYVYGPAGVLLGAAAYALRHDHRSFLNRLRLEGEAPRGDLEVSIAIVCMPGELPDALAGLPPLEPWWELLVVAAEPPVRLPPGARFLGAPARDRNAMRDAALRACRGAMLATLDGSSVPAPGWLDRVREAGRRGDLVVGGAFEHDRRSVLARAYQAARFFAWRPERPAAWLGDHPATNAAFRVDVARRLGGFAVGGALVLRLAGFGARPVRFDPAMRVRLTGRVGWTSLTRGLAGTGRLRGAVTCRYLDIRPLHRAAVVATAPLVGALLFARVVRRSIRERSGDVRLWLGLPLVAIGLGFATLGRMLGTLRPGAAGGVVPTSDEEVAALAGSPAGAPRP